MRSTVLVDAHDAVHGQRNTDYGHPLDNHQTTADMFTAYLGIPISPEQVCMLNVLQKVSRTKQTFTHDGLVDIAGYAHNAEIVINERNDRAEEAAQLNEMGFSEEVTKRRPGRPRKPRG